MNSKQEQPSSIQEDASNNHNNESLLAEAIPIKGTPFILRKQQDKWFITMGDFRITEPTDTDEEQWEKLENEKWMIIIQMIAIAIKLHKEDKDL